MLRQPSFSRLKQMRRISDILRSGHCVAVSRFHHVELGHRRGIEANTVPGEQGMAS